MGSLNYEGLYKNNLQGTKYFRHKSSVQKQFISLKREQRGLFIQFLPPSYNENVLFLVARPSLFFPLEPNSVLGNASLIIKLIVIKMCV